MNHNQETRQTSAFFIALREFISALHVVGMGVNRIGMVGSSGDSTVSIFASRMPLKRLRPCIVSPAVKAWSVAQRWMSSRAPPANARRPGPCGRGQGAASRALARVSGTRGGEREKGAAQG